MPAHPAKTADFALMSTASDMSVSARKGILEPTANCPVGWITNHLAYVVNPNLGCGII